VVDGDQDAAADAAADLREALGSEADDAAGPVAHVVGQQALWAGFHDRVKQDLAEAERAGFPLIALILLAVVGSLAAALLPVVLGIVAVVVAGGAIFLLAQATTVSIFVTNAASMIGIGVAVDYSLFVLARHRQEVAAGATRAQAASRALRTSGRAVAFSGATVAVSLAGLLLVDSTTIRSMAAGAIVVVAVSVLAALALLPVLILLLGRRAEGKGRVVGRIAELWRRRRPPRDGDRWAAWTARVMRRPVVSLLAAGGVLIALAAPTLALESNEGALAQLPPGDEAREGAEAVGRALGPGSLGPVQVVASFARGDAATPANRRALAAYVAAVRGLPGVARVSAPEAAVDGRSALVAIVPATQPEAPAARRLVERLRAEAPRTPLGGVADVQVGGATAQVMDFRDLVAGSMWKIVLFVVAVSLVVLVVLLRSVVLPLKAVVLNLLTVGAAYGVLVIVFQWGWLDGLLGYDSLGYVHVLTLPFLFAVVFGLSMDYEVFMLSRVRERFLATQDNELAVHQGLSAAARTVTGAAAIMVAVFAVFAVVSVPSVKEIGVELAVAVALDATLVRLVLVPASMRLFGSLNWWAPGWLRRLPGPASQPAVITREPSRVPVGL
jgi:RND superfamily putative drug exporter